MRRINGQEIISVDSVGEQRETANRLRHLVSAACNKFLASRGQSTGKWHNLPIAKEGFKKKPA